MTDPIIARLIADFLRRSAAGQRKYAPPKTARAARCPVRGGGV